MQRTTIEGLSSSALSLYRHTDDEITMHDRNLTRDAAGTALEADALGTDSYGDRGIAAFLVAAHHAGGCATMEHDGPDWEEGCTCGLVRARRLARLALAEAHLGADPPSR